MPGGFGIGKEPENLEGDIAKDGNAGKSSKKPKKKKCQKTYRTAYQWHWECWF